MTTGASPASWLAETGLALDDSGFLLVDKYLRSKGQQDIFAAGDVATIESQHRPKSGVYAVRQAGPLFHNIRATLMGRKLSPYRPQKNFLKLLGTGKGQALAEKSWFSAHGSWCWRLKEWIDRRFMTKLNDLPSMSTSEEAMRCFGCAAKADENLLRGAIREIESEAAASPAIVSGLKQEDDAAVIDVGDKLLVQSFDFMPALLTDPFLNGKVTAIHCFSDIFAMGAQAHSALANVILPEDGNGVNKELLSQTMAGVQEALREMGAQLVGGHTSLGKEFGVGLSCNGFAISEHLKNTEGAQVGDALILTKALGTGVIFAAQMRGRCQGQWLDASEQSMLQSNKAAADILGKFEVRACTDVTGFGFLGHLREIINAGFVGADVVAASVPLLPGVDECFDLGIQSSLHESNLLASQSSLMKGPAHVHPALFDPQTSGGLLLTISQEQSEDFVAALRDAGYKDTARVGRITKQQDGVGLINVV